MEGRGLLSSILLFISPIVVLLSGWEILSYLQILNPALFPRPSEIIWVMIDLFNPFTKSFLKHSIFLDICFSLYRLLYACLIATLAGISVGIIMGRSRIVYRFLDPMITVALPVPGIAWAPIFMLWMGFGNGPIITVGALAAFFPIVVNTAAGVRSIDKKLVWSAQSAGADRRAVFVKVLLPSSASYILTGLKLGLARGWRTIIAVEMIAATLFGLGYVIFDARDYARHSIVYTGIAILAITYFLIENLIKQIERYTIEKWGVVQA